MDDANEAKHRVVINDEEQYSIWWAERALPPGWREAGFAGTREACLAHIESVWTDMRPLSLRRRMDEMGDLETTRETGADEG